MDEKYNRIKEIANKQQNLEINNKALLLPAIILFFLLVCYYQHSCQKKYLTLQPQ